MYIATYTESIEHGLAHLESKDQPAGLSIFNKAIGLLEAGVGSRSGCLGTVSMRSEARSMSSYFRDGNLETMKHWAYLSGKARIMLEHETKETIGMEYLLWPLISDNEELIEWYCSNPLFYESTQDPSKKQKINTHEFFRLQMQRALTRQWDALAEDCQRALAEPEVFKRELKPRLAIFEFLLALARGDESGMTARLLDRCTPRQRARSYQFESGLTNNFIVSYATLYAKIAWRSGFELELGTPWVPREWLPVRPLQKYEAPWPFMENFDIWQPFDGEWAPWSPKRAL